MERTAEKWVVWEQKKEKSRNHKVTGFFDGGSGGFEHHCTEQVGQCR